jgi:hypothetical protein
LAKDCRLDPRSPQVLGTIALHGKRAAVASIRAMPAAAEAGHPLIATAAFWLPLGCTKRAAVALIRAMPAAAEAASPA